MKSLYGRIAYIVLYAGISFILGVFLQPFLNYPIFVSIPCIFLGFICGDKLISYLYQKTPSFSGQGSVWKKVLKDNPIFERLLVAVNLIISTLTTAFVLFAIALADGRFYEEFRVASIGIQAFLLSMLTLMIIEFVVILIHRLSDMMDDKLVSQDTESNMRS